MVIVMCFNDKYPYVEQAKTAIKSIQMNSPEYEVVLYLVNFSKNKFKEFKVNHVDLDDIAYITGYSLLAMYKTLMIYKQPILWLDADVLIRGDLSGIMDDVTTNTLKILKRDNAKTSNVFNTGVVVIGYSDVTMRMMNIASERSSNHPIWYSDQLYLYKTYLEYSDEINLVNLLDQPKWHDVGGRENSFDTDSIIWHCKSSHFNENLYREEYEYYKNAI